MGAVQFQLALGSQVPLPRLHIGLFPALVSSASGLLSANLDCRRQSSGQGRMMLRKENFQRKQHCWRLTWRLSSIASVRHAWWH